MATVQEQPIEHIAVSIFPCHETVCFCAVSAARDGGNPARVGDRAPPAGTDRRNEAPREEGTAGSHQTKQSR